VRAFIRDWLVPPALLGLWRRWRAPRIQKFWSGAPLPACPAEAAYFSSAGHAGLTLTRQDDSRNAAKVVNAGRLPLPRAPGDHVQLAVAADKWSPQDRLTISVGANSLTHSGLAAARWLDLRIAARTDDAEMTLRTTQPVFVTVPRRVTTLPPQAAGVRHFVVVVLDGMTPHLRIDGAAAEGLTPNIERFFAGGFFAPNGWSTGEWTLPATGSFCTGLYTSRHGMHHPTKPMRMPEKTTLAEIFQAAGFQTLGFSTANRFTPAYGSHRGFDRFIYHWPYPGHTSMDYDPARWCDELLGHLDTHRFDRSFIYVHFPDTHPAWNVPPLTRAFNLQRRGDSTGHDLDALARHASAESQGRQLNGIRLHDLDRLLGGIFDFIDRNLAGQTVVALTADHGTPWAQLRRRRPADEPYLVDHRTHVEFRMRGPGVPARTLKGLCSPTVDLMPTLLAAAGLQPPPGLDGRDLLDPGYRRDFAVSESLYGGVYELAIRDGKRAYFEKFRMTDDPLAVSGPAFYTKCFALDAADYCSPLYGDFAELKEAARAHRDAVRMA
jgi:arylsulfatase A-like enzyme